MNWVAYGIAFLIGITSMIVPQPFDKSALGVFVISFLILIFVGHKAAFRAHSLGLFGQYTEPTKVLGEKLTPLDRRILMVSLMVIVGLGVGLLYKMNAG